MAFDLLHPSPDRHVESLRAPLAAIRRRQTVPPDVVLLVPFNVARYMRRFVSGAGLRISARVPGQWTAIAAIDEALTTAVSSAAARAGSPLPAPAMDAAIEAILACYPSACLQLVQYVFAVTVRSMASYMTAAVFLEVATELVARLERCALAGGEPVGSLAAAAIAQPSTQTCLDTFHSTGAEVKGGVVRLQEVIEQSPSANCCVVVEPFHPAVATQRHLMERIALSLLPVILRDVVVRTVFAAELPAASAPVHALMSALARPATSSYAIFFLDKELLCRTQMTVVEVLRNLRAQVRVPCSGTTIRCAAPFVALHFDASYTSRSAEASARACEMLLLRGFTGIFSAHVRPRFTSEHEPPAAPVFDLHCMCKDLSPFFLSDASVFNLKTIRVSNVTVACATYGIEAALSTLFNEIKTTVTDGGHVNNHHMYLLACNICHSGRLLATTRHGMDKGSASVMQRASFEMPKYVFVQATTYGERCDDISKCLSTSTITGGLCGVGTGMVHLYEDGTGMTAASAASAASRTIIKKTDAVAGCFPEHRTPAARPITLPCDSGLQWWDHTKPPEEYVSLLYASAVHTLEARRSACAAPPRAKRNRGAPDTSEIDHEGDDDPCSFAGASSAALLLASTQPPPADAASTSHRGAQAYGSSSAGDAGCVRYQPVHDACDVFHIARFPPADDDLRYLPHEFRAERDGSESPPLRHV